MTVQLTPDLERLVNDRIAAGGYDSAVGVVRQALLLLEARESEARDRVESLRTAIRIGLDQADRGELSPLDIDEIKLKGRRLLEAGRSGE